MTDAPRSLDPDQLGAYFALIEVSSLLRHAVEQQLREAGDLSYVQFQLLARLGDSPTGSRRMTDLGIRFPVSEREQLGNKNVTSQYTLAIIPSFIPKNREMDDFEINTAAGLVTMKHDMNKVLVQNKTAAGIMPFIN